MMGRSSKMSQLPYDAARLLAELRREKGFSSFGLLIQALFAHVILRLGGDILDIRSPGHPDIRAIFGGRIHNIEVETAKRKTNPRRLEAGDLEVLLTTKDWERGYFCVLDCGPPVAWLCVDIASLGQRVTEKLPISLLRAYSDWDYSVDCTTQFSELVTSEAGSLHHLTYGQLRREALDGSAR